MLKLGVVVVRRYVLAVAEDSDTRKKPKSVTGMEDDGATVQNCHELFQYMYCRYFSRVSVQNWSVRIRYPRSSLIHLRGVMLMLMGAYACDWGRGGGSGCGGRGVQGGSQEEEKEEKEEKEEGEEALRIAHDRASLGKYTNTPMNALLHG